MILDVVNGENEKVGSIELSDDLFGGRVNQDLVWESVVRAQAATRRGTHATKNRALVSGSGRKPWRQKGTGRARVGSIRTPLWRKGGTVFGPQPRSYEYSIPRKVERGALRSALADKVQNGGLTVVDRLDAGDGKTKSAVELLRRFGADDRKTKTLILDVKPDGKLAQAMRNLPRVQVVASGRVTARDVVDARLVIATRAAIERLQAAV